MVVARDERQTPVARRRGRRLPPIAGGAGFALVGSAGASSATGTSETPAWGTGETRAAGNLLICWALSSGTGVPTTSTPGWAVAVSKAGTSSAVAIFWKIAAGGDAAPTISFGASNGIAFVAEFSGNATTSPVDQTASATSATSPATATAAAADVAAGELLVYVSASHKSGGGNTTTMTNALNNATRVDVVNGGTTSSAWHFTGGYGITTTKATADSDAFSVGTTTSINDMTVAIVSFKLAAGAAVSGSASDSVTVSDAATRAAQSPVRSGPDTVTPGDSASAHIGASRAAADAATIGDTATASQGRARTAAESVTIGDTAARGAQSLARSGPDALSVGDTATVSSGHPRPPQPAFVAHAVGYGAGPASTATTGAIDTTGATLLVAAFAFTGTPTLTDSKGNTWQLADQSITDLGVAIWYCRNPIVGTAHTFSLHADYPHLSVDAFRNIDVVAPLDAAEHVDATGAPASVHMPAVAARAYELIVTADGGVTGNNNTAIDQGFVLDDPGGGLFASGTYWGVAIAHKIVGTAQTVDPTWTDVQIHGAVLATFKPVPADVVTISDTATASGARARTAADSVAIADAATRPAQSFVRAGPEALTVNDSAAGPGARARSTADAIAIGPDTASSQRGTQRGAADAVTIADTGSRAAQTDARSTVDALSISEQAAARIAAARQSADALPIADSAAARRTFARNSIDTLSLSDVATEVTTGAGGGQADDAVSIVDAAQRAAQARDRNVTDQATIGDQAGAHAVTTRTTGDVVTFADAATRAEPRARTAADAFGISDNATRGPASAVRYTTDTWPVTDHAARLGSHARNAGDAIALSDTAIAGEPPPVPPEQPFLHTEAQPRLHTAATPTTRRAGEPILHTEIQPRLHRERQPRTA